MTRFRGVLNRNAMNQLNDSLSTSGILRGREVQPNNFIFDVNAPVVHMSKTQAVANGTGRLQFAANVLYVPQYVTAYGTSVGSGYTVPSDGMYYVQGHVSCSGDRTDLPEEVYAGAVLVNSVPASGTETFAPGNGLAALSVCGVVHAKSGQVINIGAKTVRGTLITVGSEDLVNAPAATLTVFKLPSDELGFNV